MKTYKKPFRLDGGRIVDASGKEVRLWGVNYYMPFNHNYVNIEEMGIDHYRAIDRDLADFKRMGIDFIRMHVYEREITDILGNIIENDHLRVFDYLMDRLEAEGIYVMITPITWFNTVVNQQSVTRQYAFWSVGSCPAFGFSNLYTHHEMCWNEDAVTAQENYLRQFFKRKNRFNGKILPEFECVVVVEDSNETAYPTPQLIRTLQNEDAAGNPYREQERRIVGLYEEYLAQRGEPDTEATAWAFCATLVERYICRMFAVVNACFGGTIIRSHIHYRFTQPEIYECLTRCPIDAISVTVYAPNHFDSSYNDTLNPLTELRRLHDYYQPLLTLGKGLICYEFDAPSTLTGRAMGGFGYMMASLGIQMAAHFTYTPIDVAPYNAGWVVHFLNLRHTPSKAAAFIAGGEIFRKTQPGAPIPDSDDIWTNEHFEVNFAKDRVVYHDGETLIHSGPITSVPDLTPRRIIGSGSGPFVSREGNGCYFLEVLDDSRISLTVLPDQWYVNDPFRGKAFRSMANRYIDTNREWIVSRLRERGTLTHIRFPGFEAYRVERIDEKGGRLEVLVTNGAFMADPGQYILTRQSANSSI